MAPSEALKLLIDATAPINCNRVTHDAMKEAIDTLDLIVNSLVAEIPAQQSPPTVYKSI